MSTLSRDIYAQSLIMSLIYKCSKLYIYIYIYIEREREREGK